MKTIGLLGGMSGESTVLYYEQLNALVQERLGAQHSAKVIINSLDFEEVVCLQEAGQWERLADFLTHAALQLVKADAQLLAMASNTAHYVAESVQKAIDIPFVHIADATGQAIQEAGLSRIGLLGTRFTLEAGFYQRYLEEKFGITVILPEKDERMEIHRLIFDELCQGIFKDASRQWLRQVVENLTSKGSQGIVLGCTELPLLLKPEDVPGTPLFDTLRLHVKHLVNESLV